MVVALRWTGGWGWIRVKLARRGVEGGAVVLPLVAALEKDGLRPRLVEEVVTMVRQLLLDMVFEEEEELSIAEETEEESFHDLLLLNI